MLNAALTLPTQFCETGVVFWSDSNISASQPCYCSAKQQQAAGLTQEEAEERALRFNLGLSLCLARALHLNPGFRGCLTARTPSGGDVAVCGVGISLAVFFYWNLLSVLLV